METVHGILNNSSSLVRSGGKWFHKIRSTYTLVTVAEAVELMGDDAAWLRGVPGGRVFDRALAERRSYELMFTSVAFRLMQCSTCGAAVSDLPLHRVWHRSSVGDRI